MPLALARVPEWLFDPIRTAEHASGLMLRWQAACRLRSVNEPGNSPSGPLRDLIHAAGDALYGDRYLCGEELLDAFDAELALQVSAKRLAFLRMLNRREADIMGGT